MLERHRTTDKRTVCFLSAAGSLLLSESCSYCMYLCPSLPGEQAAPPFPSSQGLVGQEGRCWGVQVEVIEGLTWTIPCEGGFTATAAQLQHRVPCWGYVFQEPQAPPIPDRAAISAAGIDEVRRSATVLDQWSLLRQESSATRCRRVPSLNAAPADLAGETTTMCQAASFSFFAKAEVMPAVAVSQLQHVGCSSLSLCSHDPCIDVP